MTKPVELDLQDERILLPLVRELLAAPEYAANPLRAPLAHLLSHCDSQRLRLERLVRISDGFHSMSRSAELSLAEQYDKQLRRLEKLARISDRYQNSLRELSEALKVNALHDPLTGLDNRRSLMERLREESERATRKNKPFALAIIDADRFKSINDHFGHDVGDQALCTLSNAIKTSLRDYDLCGRWGGEEFLLLLPETESQEALLVIERIRRAIADTVILPASDESPTLTASFGLTTYRVGENFSETIKRADTCLLAAKSQGRNRVISG